MHGTWRLQKINGNTEIPSHPQVLLEEDGVSLTYGNKYSTSVQVNGTNIDFGIFCGTKMHNPQEPPEKDVIKAFEATKKFKVVGNTLTMLNGANKPTVELTK